jgi:uncharacterized cupredoxin-like copper-binding protein
MDRLTRYWMVIGLTAALGLLAVGVAAAAPHAKKTTHASTSSRTASVRIVIKSDEEHGKKGSDGKWHDAFLPANFKVQKGVRVRVTVTNYDDMPHSFTSSSLHVNKTIPAARGKKPGKTTFTFVAKKAGKYLWWCAKPCDPWAMSHVGFMRGYVTVKG